MIYRLVASVLLSAFCATAQAAISLQLAANYDATRTTAYPNGDNPQAGCTSITTDGYTVSNLGNGGGQACKQAAGEYDLSVFGSGTRADAYMAYKDAGAGDVQIETRFVSPFAGSTLQFSGVGVGLRESAPSTSWFFQCKALQGAVNIVQCEYGSTAGGYTSQYCAASGTLLPAYAGVSYDLSSGDVKGFTSSDGATWNECLSTNRAMSDVLGFVLGASKSTTQTLQLTIDGYALGTTIDFYTPSDPPGGAPTLVTPIADQTGVQGSSFSLSCASNWTGATSYSASGLHGSTGLSFNTSACSFSGTLNANDVGSRSVTVTATNASGSTSDVFSLAVSASSGDVFLIPTASSSRTFDCASTNGAAGSTWASIRTSGTGTTPGAGDAIVLDDGVHSGANVVLTMKNCHGSASANLTIRNDTSGTGQAIIRKSSGTAGNFVWKFANVSYLTVDGTGKWSGAPAGTCGIDTSTFAEGRTQCGIKVTKSSTSVADPSSFIKFDGVTTKSITVKGIEHDALGQTGTSIAMDSADLLADNPGAYREDIVITQNYLHDTSTGIYLGPNWYEGHIPLRRVELSYNLIEDMSRRCAGFKAVTDGPNSIHHNHCYRTGTGGPNFTNGYGFCLQVQGGAADIYNNYIEDCGESGIAMIQNDFPASYGPEAGSVYNNIIVRTGLIGPGDGRGIMVRRSGPAEFQISPLTIYNNTIISPQTWCVELDMVSGGTKTVRDNICANSPQSSTVTGATDTNNRKGTIASQNFVNPGADNYELTSTSPACNNSTAGAPATDYEDEARPQDSADDQGADEAAACP